MPILSMRHEADDVVLGLEAVGRLHNTRPPTQPHLAIVLVGELLPLLLREALDLELVEELCGVREVLAVALRRKSHHLSDRQRSSFIAEATQLTTASEVDAAIRQQQLHAADYFTRTQSDSRYFPNNANPGNAEVFTLVRDSVSIPRQIKGILPRAPLAWSYLFSGTITELRCDAYSKVEANGRYLSSTGYTTTLDGRYLVTNANAGSSEVFTVIRDASAVPRQLRGILSRTPLGWSYILSGTVTELTCDAWTKAEADGRFYMGLQNLNLQVIDHETRLSSLEASGDVSDPVVKGAVHGSGTALTLRAGSTNVRIEAQDTTTLANFGLVENFLGGAPRLRVDEKLFIDDVSGAAAGLKTNAVSARPGDNLLTINGGVNGVSVIGAGLAVAGIARATAQVTTPVLATDAGQI